MKKFSLGRLTPTPEFQNFNSVPKISATKVRCKLRFSTPEFHRLIELYLTQKLSLKRLAKLCHCSPNMIRAHMAKSGVQIRSRREAVRQKWSEEDYVRKQCEERGRRKLRIGDTIVLDSGYIGIYSPDPTGKRRFPFLKEHRVVAEKRLKRKLCPDEQIHHADGDKINNDHSNLFFFPTKEFHDQYHKRFGYGSFKDLPRRLKIKAKRYLRKFATCVADFRSRLNKIKQALIRSIGRIIQFLIEFESSAYGRDSPLPGKYSNLSENNRDESVLTNRTKSN